jgi:2-dehydro-3-deoxy-D-arabinonate dehydratase
LAGYLDAENQVKLGVQVGETLHAVDETKIPSLDWLLQNVSSSELTDLVKDAKGAVVAATNTTLKGLLDRQAIWAAGVTYKTSEEARERESDNSTIYTRVYSAERPELFGKAIGYETVSHGDSVGIRYDATWSVPEPELTVVYNSRLEVMGFTIGNDMSSRDIEGENPLYLPQAKVYDTACSLGPRIWLQPGANVWPQADIQIEIKRNGERVFSGTTSTARLHRTLETLTDYLGRCKRFAYGVFLMTGTGVVPPDDFTLQKGDEVQITIPPIGTLVNTVQVVNMA